MLKLVGFSLVSRDRFMMWCSESLRSQESQCGAGKTVHFAKPLLNKEDKCILLFFVTVTDDRQETFPAIKSLYQVASRGDTKRIIIITKKQNKKTHMTIQFEIRR